VRAEHIGLLDAPAGVVAWAAAYLVLVGVAGIAAFARRDLP